MEKEQSKENVLQKDMDKLIRHHVWASIGVGLVPVPLVDMVALTAIQLNLVRKIAKNYEIPFSKDKVKNILGALVGSAIPSATGGPLAASITKFVPVIGWTTGAITMPVFAGASTYAVGKVFVQHFATGGTFLTFDTDKVKEYFAKKFKEGKEVAKEGDKLAEDVEKNEKPDEIEKTEKSGNQKKNKNDDEKTDLNSSAKSAKKKK